MSLTINPMDAVTTICTYVAAVASKAFLSPGGAFAATSLLVALVISAGFLILRRKPGRRRVSPAALVRALLPRSWLLGPSSRTDYGFLAFNMLLFGLLFGWAIVAARQIAGGLGAGLTSIFGPVTPTALSEPVAMAIVTLVLFLAYELAYWIDHYLSHRIPLLWEFHKVHHAAEVLTPVTNARVHPIDSIVFNNIAAIVMGLAGGITYYLLGRNVRPYVLWDENAIAFLFAYAVTHLQHSHMWIAFTGIWGKLFLSPAHHQIHHSTNPIHFDKNMGSSLAVFDWLFGTLHIPARQRERLTFGIEPGDMNPHSLTDSMLAPVRNAARLALPGRADDGTGATAKQSLSGKADPVGAGGVSVAR